MDKKLIDKVKQEKEIPTEVMDQLIRNRNAILENKISQEKRPFIYKHSKKLVFSLVVAAVLFSIIIASPQINSAIQKALGIRRDEGVAFVDDNGIIDELHLVSTQNGREIILTKFVATKKKFAFDYQFKLDDEKLKELLEKQGSPDRIFKKLSAESQDIDIGLFVNGGSEDIRGGGMFGSTFRVEGDTFYGSIVSTLNKEDIPEDTHSMSLHIYRLGWVDTDELDRAYLEGVQTGNPFGVENALEYEGDWRFDIEYKPLTQTAETQISNIHNITDIKVSNDALQTTAKFKIPIKEDSYYVGKNYPGVTLYKDGVKAENVMESVVYNPETGEFKITCSLSALDKTSAYKIQVDEIDFEGNPIEEIGYFELKNK